MSLPVRSLERSVSFYEAALGALGYQKLVVRERTVGFGKRYAELWLNLREAVAVSDGAHMCLRAKSAEQVDAFYRGALANGGSDDGAPGEREHDGEGQAYYAAFVRDPDGNRIEAVTFIPRSR